ncbi:MAG: hypothetical protein EBX80_06040 [Acidimicrobiia bacterium]|nr:hypothetical protein [Acidimicrobiia bacterium]
MEHVVARRAGPAPGHEQAQPVLAQDVDDDGGHARARAAGAGELELDDVAEGEERREGVEVSLVERVVARGEEVARARVAREQLRARRVHAEPREDSNGRLRLVRRFDFFCKVKRLRANRTSDMRLRRGW